MGLVSTFVCCVVLNNQTVFEGILVLAITVNSFGFLVSVEILKIFYIGSFLSDLGPIFYCRFYLIKRMLVRLEYLI